MSKLSKKWLNNFILFGANQYPKPESEVQFLPDRKFRFDHAWPHPRIMIAVEIEGGQFGVKCRKCGGSGSVFIDRRTVLACASCGGSGRVPGGHQSAKGLARDCEKNNLAVRNGWKLFRFSTSMIDESKYYQPLFHLLPKER